MARVVVEIETESVDEVISELWEMMASDYSAVKDFITVDIYEDE